MADDIDIEEHDVLENPVIRNIFPNLAVIKKEISQYYDDAPNVKEEPDSSNVTNEILENIVIQKDNHDIPRKDNKLAPNKNLAKQTFQSTKIILGSKPNTIEKQTSDAKKDKNQDNSEESVVKIPRVFIQDIGEQIYQSKRYCHHCKRLFSTRADSLIHDLKSHLKNAHEKKKTSQSDYVKKNKKPRLNVSIEQNKKHKSSNKSKCKICGSYFCSQYSLTRHLKNIHSKNISVKYKKMAGLGALTSNRKLSIKNVSLKPKVTNICFHCNEEFPDQNLLVEHIYTVLETNQCDKSIPKLIPTPATVSECIATETVKVRIKDKLVFEDQESEYSISPSSESESENNYSEKIETNITKNDNAYKSEEKKQNTKKYYHDANGILDQFIPESSKNKRNYYSSDDVGEENENQDDPKIISKRSKIGAEYKTQPKKSTKSIIKEDLHKVNNTQNLGIVHRDLTSNKNKKSISKNISKSNKNNEKQMLGNNPRLKTNESTSENNARTKILQKFNKDGTPKAIDTKPKVNNQIEHHEDSRSKRNMFVYECIYCSSILSTTRSYYMHVFWKHKVEQVSSINKVIFDRKCKHCPRRITKKFRNQHIRDAHFDLLTKSHNEGAVSNVKKRETMSKKKPALKRKQSFVMKSIVYKCVKCDIHFVSSCVAKDHEKHMEFLINWKCFVCKKIFKKHDKHLHLKQHQFSKTVKVYQYDQSELSRLLYNCIKCAIHFTEKRYLKHDSKCGNRTWDSVYCKDCDILIDKYEYVNHEEYHKKGVNTEDFIVITGDIIKNQEELKNHDKSTCEEESTSDEETDDISSKISNYKAIHCLTFCQTCKCYLSDIAVSRKIHVQGRCSKMPRYTCPTCGLVFTSKTINTHRDHHRKVKGLQLQNFEFFDLNGLNIRPPLPDYPSCNNCEVIFVSRNAIINHICTDTNYLTCEICNVKLSENAFKLHMNFHNYNTPKETLRKSLPLSNNKYGTEQNNIVSVNEDKALNPNFSICIEKSNSLHSVGQTESQEHSVDTNKHSKISVPNRFSTEEFNVKKQDPKSNTQKNAETRNNDLIYTCIWCKISVDTYDNVIQHCQDHYSPNPLISSTDVCSKCSLNFENDAYKSHKKLRGRCDLFQKLIFDPTYFTADNSIWTKHVFSSVSPSLQKETIAKSIYQNECRIKVDVIQQGPSYLTVYKCDKCCIFINIEEIISHLNSGCHRNMEKYPCSACGIPFVSKVSRTTHEKIHHQHKDVRLKSYNILLFNCESHNNYTANILKSVERYILYQCRICDEAVNKWQRNNHKCNVYDLVKCPNCELLLNNAEIKGHVSKHSDLALYDTSNIKVILFGYKVKIIQNKVLSSSFKGVIVDYLLYKCNKCDEYENDRKLMLCHCCKFDDSKWKCPKCGNFISAPSIKQHTKMHDVDPDFTTENFIIIHFNSTKGVINRSVGKKIMSAHNADNNSNLYELDSNESQSVIELGKDCAEAQSNTKNSDGSTDNRQNNEPIAIYKCPCGLHYLEKNTAMSHVHACHPRNKIIRQNCAKCSLTFNPKELYSHILAHHGHKNKTFKYQVIELEKK